MELLFLRWRPQSVLLLICWMMTPSWGQAANPSEVIVGWDRHDGQVLLGELNCTACHAADQFSESQLVKQAPILAEVGSRVTPQYLQAYLADPQQVKPGTSMPHLLHSIPAKEKDKTVEALVHYLSSLGGPIDQLSSGSSLAQIDQGKELYHAVGCVACHQPFEPAPKQKSDPNALNFLEEEGPPSEKSVPVPLGDLAKKTTVDELAKFLQNPLHVRPSGRMPSLHLSDREARYIASYLLRDQFQADKVAPDRGLNWALYRGSWERLPDFTVLEPSGEGTCDLLTLDEVGDDQGRMPDQNFAVRFTGMLKITKPGIYSFRTRSDDGSALWVDGQRIVDNDGVHGTEVRTGRVKLRAGVHEFETAFMQQGGPYVFQVQWRIPGDRRWQAIPGEALIRSGAAMIPTGNVEFTLDPSMAEKGKQLFKTLNCTACHAVERGVPLRSNVAAGNLLELNLNAHDGCLGAKVASGRPQYALSERQRAAITHSLKELKNSEKPKVAKARINDRLNSMNCYACHARDGLGGPRDDRKDYFTYQVVVDLGDEGRLPPPLNLVGAKLTDEGFDEALYSGQRYRTYMATRMPNFGKANLHNLPALLREVDGNQVAKRQPAFSAELVEDGRYLVGSKALGCINCHAWGGYRVQGAEGLDFLRVSKRIRPGWFHEFLLDPQRFKPGTRMPAAWPNGKSFFPKVQAGDAAKQVDAIWAYLAAGEKGGLPDGLKPSDTTQLVPGSEPIVFRTFLDQVSAHAILVGYRQRTHCAFDANRVRMVLVWTGDFVSTKPTWEGRAGQYTPIPSENIVSFPEGPPIAKLESLNASWPADVPKEQKGTKRTPAGWEFQGYQLDQERNPTFCYRVDGIQVKETPGTALRQGGSYFRRQIQFVTPNQAAPEGYYFRVATGKVITRDGDWYRIDDRLRYRVTSTPNVEPTIRSLDGQQELIVPVDLSKQNASLSVELSW